MGYRTPLCLEGVRQNDPSLYIYIYILEMSSSYTWCNSTRVTHFLSHRFMRDLRDKNKTPLSITTLNTYLINSLLIISYLINSLLIISLLIKYFYVTFSLSLLSISFRFLCNFSYVSTFLVFFFFFSSLNITFLIPVLQNVQKKKKS